MTSHCTLLPEVLPNQCLSAHVSFQPEQDTDEPPLPGKTMEECSVSAGEQPQYYTQVSTKLDANLTSSGMDACTKQRYVFLIYFKDSQQPIPVWCYSSYNMYLNTLT